MKKMLLVLLVAGVGMAFTGWVISKRLAARHAAELSDYQAALEEALLEAALQAAENRPPPPSAPAEMAPASEPEIPAGPSAEDIMAELTALASSPQPSSNDHLRRTIYWLEELAQRGPAALPAIGAFLARYEDVELDTSLFQGRGARDRLPLEFVVPPSLRFGLFDVVRRIGGPEAERILAVSLAHSGRGVEVAYLAHVLQEIAPNKYRDEALGVAHTLLADTTPLASSSPLDRYHRDHLFSVLRLFGDTSFTRDAQAQLVHMDGQVDRSALDYLQETLGAQAVPLAEQAYRSLAVTNAAAKEPLARLALAFVGADAQANAFYEQAINDPVLTQSHRSNLIEDLNEDGLNYRNLTAQDLPLIENRLTLIEELSFDAMDKVNAAAFQEAYKDLVNMRAKVTGEPPGSTVLPQFRDP